MCAARSFKQEIVCVFGQPVAENPTQPMMEGAFAHHGLPWRYLTLEVSPADLPDAVRGMRAMGFRGGNCTIPHKVAVTRLLDRLAESAALIGAVNCIVRRGDELIGENTDGKGFLKSLGEVVDPRGLRCVLLGAGGAARAIGVELGLAGAAEITVVNRTPARGRELAELLLQRVKIASRAVEWNGDYRVPGDADLLVQCTPVGLFPEVDARLPLDFDTLRPQLVVCDVVPNPPSTHLLGEARRRGCRTLDGLEMLVNQGVIGFRLWTGVDPDPAVMRRALEEALDLK